jgi:uncharacterized protein (TIGR02246 family)
MRRKAVVGIIVFLALACFLPWWRGFHTVADTDASKDVLDVVRQFQNAAIHGDAAVLSQIFDAKITHFHPGSPYRFVGRERLVEEFSLFAKTAQDIHFEMVDPQVQMAGNDVAVVTYYIVESWTEKGASRNQKEKATEVYVKREGRWSMIHGHYSTE